jgi:pimeloyl-ACP methyl ester carboxylesterase
VAVFSLVHGGQHGSWCFDLLAAELARRGHITIAVDLPAEDVAAGAADYAKVVVDSLAAVDDDLVVVGHSLGGLTIPLVALARPVRRLVFLCCSYPEPGRSVADVMDEEGKPLHARPGQLYLSSPDVARAEFYNLCPRELQDWAISRLRPQARTPHLEVTPLERWPDVPRTVIFTTNDMTLPRDLALRLARRALPDVTPIEFPGDHSPFLSRPAELAELLVRLAEPAVRDSTPAPPAET